MELMITGYLQRMGIAKVLEIIKTSTVSAHRKKHQDPEYLGKGQSRNRYRSTRGSLREETRPRALRESTVIHPVSAIEHSHISQPGANDYFNPHGNGRYDILAILAWRTREETIGRRVAMDLRALEKLNRIDIKSARL